MVRVDRDRPTVWELLPIYTMRAATILGSLIDVSD